MLDFIAGNRVWLLEVDKIHLFCFTDWILELKDVNTDRVMITWQNIDYWTII